MNDHVWPESWAKASPAAARRTGALPPPQRRRCLAHRARSSPPGVSRAAAPAGHTVPAVRIGLDLVFLTDQLECHVVPIPYEAGTRQ